MTSTLDGTYRPTVGDIVWQQMYSPSTPSWTSTIAERVAHGTTYKDRQKMIVRSVAYGAHRDGRPFTRWTLQPLDPESHGYSTVEDDWCVLEPVDPYEEGRLL